MNLVVELEDLGLGEVELGGGAEDVVKLGGVD